MSRPVPFEATGYAIEASGRVHRRHADHVTDARRTTPVGLASFMPGLFPCDVCFPAPKQPGPVKRGKGKAK